LSMIELSKFTLLVAAVSAGVGAFGLAEPARFRAAVRALPRHRPTAWVLTAVCLAWAAWMLLTAPLGRFEGWKPMVYLLAPALFFLTVNYVEELLAARALGGLLLLFPDPVLAASRMNDSPWRLVVVAVMYVWAVSGMILVLYPYQLRLKSEKWLNTDVKCRLWGTVNVALSAALFVLAIRAL
jgi:hypothetical protein